MAFDYVVSLDLTGRRCVVFGGGPLAADRVDGLLASGAVVTVVTPAPGPGVVGPAVTHVARSARATDLAGAFLAIATREDDADVPALWAAAEERGVLFAALDDVAHCHFGAVSTIRRGALTVTISTAGRAPALAKRLRRWLEPRLGPEVGRLVDVVHDARAQVLPRRVGFDEWAARWEDALADLDHLAALVRDGHEDRAVEHIHRHVAPVGTTASPVPSGAGAPPHRGPAGSEPTRDPAGRPSAPRVPGSAGPVSATAVAP